MMGVMIKILQAKDWLSVPEAAKYLSSNDIAREEFLSKDAALLSKLKGQAQRLCLLLHCLDAALAETDGINPVSEDTMHRALLLANWMKEHQKQCWHFENFY